MHQYLCVDFGYRTDAGNCSEGVPKNMTDLQLTTVRTRQKGAGFVAVRYLRKNGNEYVRTLFKALDSFDDEKVEIAPGCQAVEDALYGFNNDLDAALAYYSFLHRYAVQISRNKQRNFCYQLRHKNDYELRNWVLPPI